MAEASPTRKRWPWGRIVLAISLAFNLLIIGMIAGSHFGSKSSRDPGDRATRALAYGPYGRALSREDRKALGAAYRDRRSAGRAKRTEMREIGMQVVAALKAEPFEVATVETLLARQASLAGEMQMTGQDVLLSHLAELPTAERAAYADRLEAIFARRGRRN